MTDQRSPLDAALDLVLYAPVGLALTISEELPKLAAKGRTGLGTRITTARVVGQFAVAQGRKEVSRRLNSEPAGPARSQPQGSPAPAGPASAAPPRPTPPRPSPTATAPAATAPAATAPAAPTSGVPGSFTAASTNGAGPAPAAPPAVSDLAIPGYDSLSASQVVQRLAGLSGPELQAVKDYESANRGRRTILARVGQLQSH